jgi:hypothetical protein
MSGRKGRKEDLKWLGVLGSLVLGEQKPRTLGDGGYVSKKYQKWGLRLLWLKREHDGSYSRSTKSSLFRVLFCVTLFGFFKIAPLPSFVCVGNSYL